MRFTINWCEKKITQTNKEYMKATIKDETGVETEVSIWSDFPFYKEIRPGAVVEGIITVKGVYKNLVAGSRAIRPANTNYLMEKKAGQIAEAQAVKAQSIADAQDRSAWMWSKNNITLLVANSEETKNLPIDKQIEIIHEKATDLYNLEPNRPF